MKQNNKPQVKASVKKMKQNNKSPKVKSNHENKQKPPGKQPHKNNKEFQKKTKPQESDLIKEIRAKYESINLDEVKTFKDIPLSSKTQRGLQKYNFKVPTAIQLQTLKYSLQGEDILGAAQTGSGKTLAFLIPLLEILYCNQWTSMDGLGALVITPTRELAYQIFAELRKVGEFHDFSAGLVIGGKDLKFESERMDKCNIIICTPGRLLQHMDQNPLFNCDSLKTLILDEADRILDMGFAPTMNAIIDHLPPVRQTLLFSATQTKSVKDLARLSLKNPKYVSVHDTKEYSTPSGLQQSYMVCELHEKLSILYSFIRNHLKSKIIIFFSSCKQTKFVYEIMCKLRPGMSVLALYGSLHQLKRMEIYETFCKKTCAVLFATDLAARGLDFPKVNWVVQADCPEDPETYIHRVGRTARFDRGGESLLLLLPSELKMLDALEKHKIPIEKIDINPERLKNPVRKIEAYLAMDPALKETAQRAFKSYFKAIYLMKNKAVFNVRALDATAYAYSLGMAITPRIRFLEKAFRKDNLKVNDPNEKFDDVKVNIGNDSAPRHIKFENAQKSENVLSKDNDSDDDDGMFKIKRANHDIDGVDEIKLEENISTGRNKKVITRAAAVKKILNKQIKPNKKITFDDEGDAVIDTTKQKASEAARAYENEEEGGINIEKARLILQEEDQFDKQLFKEKVKAKKREAKRKLKEKNKKEKDEEEEVDDFGSDDDEEGSEPDLSWLPDPDKIYGPAKDEDLNTDDNDDDEEIEEEKPIKKEFKRKAEVTVESSPDKIARKKKKISNATALNVNDAEELAMMLLRK